MLDLSKYNPQEVRPIDAPYVAIDTGSTAWGFGAKVELIASGEIPYDFKVLGIDTADFFNEESVFRIFKGEVGSEEKIEEVPYPPNKNEVHPLSSDVIPAGSRISVDVADRLAPTVSSSLKLLVCRVTS